jgi:hypothetical protein
MPANRGFSNCCGMSAGRAGSRRSFAPIQATKDAVCRMFSAGATGLEPATSGVTGRQGATGYNRLRPGITGWSRHFLAERTGYDRFPPTTTRQSLCGRCVVRLVPIQATVFSRVGVFAGRDDEPLPIRPSGDPKRSPRPARSVGEGVQPAAADECREGADDEPVGAEEEERTPVGSGDAGFGHEAAAASDRFGASGTVTACTSWTSARRLRPDRIASAGAAGAAPHLPATDDRRRQRRHARLRNTPVRALFHPHPLRTAGARLLGGQVRAHLDRLPRHGRRRLDPRAGDRSPGRLPTRRRARDGADGRGALLLTQVSAGGSYFGDIFFGLLVFGPGVGLAFVTASIAALAGVPEHESGLASGLSNTSFQIGAALGVAVVTTVAVTRTDDYVAANADANPLVALTEGFQSAFLAVAILAGIGIALALPLLGRPRGVPQERLAVLTVSSLAPCPEAEPSPAPAGD